MANGLFYEGTRNTRERRWLPGVTVADSKETLTAGSRMAALGFSRFLVANIGMARGAVKDMRTYSIGPGLLPQSQVEESGVADLYEEYFTEVWGAQADLTGRHHFQTLQGLLCEALDVDGDVGLSLYAPSRKHPGQVQVIEGHRITSEQTQDPNYCDGVRVDRAGRPVGYRVKEGTDKFREIPAHDFVLLYDPDRCDQYRGMTALAHAIAHLRDVLDTIDFEKVGIKMASGIGLAIKTATGHADSGSSYIENGFKASDTGGLAWDTWTAGMIPRLKLGESIDSFSSNRPSAAFMGFLEFLIRDIAVGLGVPFEFLWDVSKLRGNGSRFILAKAQRRFEQRQALFVQRLLNRIWFWAIGRAIDRGDLPAVPGWHWVRWQAPPKPTVDFGREAQSHRDDLRYGNRTLKMDAAEQGLDWQSDIRGQLDRETDDLLERAVAKVAKYGKQGLTLDRALHLLRGDSPNAPVLATENAKSAEDTEEGEEGDNPPAAGEEPDGEEADK